MPLEFQVLGGVDLQGGDRGGLASILARSKRLALLAYLCLEGTAVPVRRDTLLPLFWPESDETHARAALNQALHVLRSCLGRDILLTRGRGEVGIDGEAVRCDAVEFRRALATGNPRHALDLYRGDLLPGFHIDAPEFERWLDEERSTLRSEALDAALALSAAEEAEADSDRALATWRRALEIAPDSEAAARGLVLALWRTGRRAEALETYATFAERLAGAYDAAPGPNLETLVDRIRSGETSPTARWEGVEAVEARAVSATGGEPGSGPESAKAAEPEPRTPAWLRAAIPLALGIATIVAIGLWAAGTSASPDRPPYLAELEYDRAWQAWTNGDGYDSVRLYASRTIEADSGHARAWALLSHADLLLATRGEAPERGLLPEAYLAARRAVTLDDTLAAAWQALATAEWSRWHWELAEQGFRRALSLPTGGTWEALSRADFSVLLADLGRCEEAWKVIEPYARLAPDDRSLGSSPVVRVPYLCRDWETAIRETDRAMAGGDSSFEIQRYRFLSRLLAGDTGRAAADLAHMRATLAPGSALDGLEALLLARDGDMAAARRAVSALSERAASGEPLDGANPSLRVSLAQIHATVGDRDAAIALLSAEMETKGSVQRLSSDPLFDPLREDPGFDALLARMGLVCRRADGRQTCRQSDPEESRRRG